MPSLSDVAMFLLELAVYVAVAWWAFNLTDTFLLGVVLALVAIAVMGTIWAAFGSPQARWPVYGFPRIMLELLWFGAGVLALFAAGTPIVAVILAVVFVVVMWLRLRPARTGPAPDDDVEDLSG
ncbi:YrdB family protein [Luteipulveratus mongoliensis]|uniref:DUF2568 domain-containing protein n=1 Tax=Luteipulveratus mongoliensis TaxID=571913 RepID=A0A0K1JDX9_9MICO|nr:YrdB family protein [Luteipulveratus mongoliensis]AKU14790.1 hypothetical protein VV02_01065 [Luteipulveratus mongoliensis]